MKKKSIPAAITIFGAKGDLTQRKLIPALYNLFLEQQLSSEFAIYCVDFLPAEQDVFKNELLNAVDEFSRSGKADPIKWKLFSDRIFYQQGDFTKKDTFSALKETLNAFDAVHKARAIRLFYFAVAPRFIETIAEALYLQKCCNKKSSDRLVVEKPFGTDLESARNLNQFLGERFAEKQIYRIDHYLGKETVQNIMAFRFANYVFEPLWNKTYIDYVQINLAEEVGVGKRGGYYDSAGALRDMVQNHLLQLLCVVGMECPPAYEAEAIRDAKTKLIKQVRIYSPGKEVFKNIIRGQYAEGMIDGHSVPSYRQEEQVGKDSTTETFVVGKFFIDNKRWKGVPFFLGTGKSLPRQRSVIMIQFKDSPHRIFKDDIIPNRLIISIQPELEIKLLFESKIPGPEMKLKAVDMDFTYQEAYAQSLPEAYEALLVDVLDGDATLFMRADQVEAAWKVVMPILETWQKYPSRQLHFYKAGTWGPKAAFALLKPFATKWFQYVQKDMPVSEMPS